MVSVPIRNQSAGRKRTNLGGVGFLAAALLLRAVMRAIKNKLVFCKDTATATAALMGVGSVGGRDMVLSLSDLARPERHLNFKVENEEPRFILQDCINFQLQ